MVTGFKNWENENEFYLEISLLRPSNPYIEKIINTAQILVNIHCNLCITYIYIIYLYNSYHYLAPIRTGGGYTIYRRHELPGPEIGQSKTKWDMPKGIATDGDGQTGKTT